MARNYQPIPVTLEKGKELIQSINTINANFEQIKKIIIEINFEIELIKKTIKKEV